MSKKDTKSLFKGKETYKEELNEAKAIKSGKEVKKMASGGRIDGVAERGHTKGKMYAKGGKCMAEGGRTRKQISDDSTSDETFKKGGKAKCYAAGGITRADGCAQRGKTRGNYI